MEVALIVVKRIKATSSEVLMPPSSPTLSDNDEILSVNDKKIRVISKMFESLRK